VGGFYNLSWFPVALPEPTNPLAKQQPTPADLNTSDVKSITSLELP
jgi:hypothetical protein